MPQRLLDCDLLVQLALHHSLALALDAHARGRDRDLDLPGAALLHLHLHRDLTERLRPVVVLRHRSVPGADVSHHLSGLLGDGRRGLLGCCRGLRLSCRRGLRCRRLLAACALGLRLLLGSLLRASSLARASAGFSGHSSRFATSGSNLIQHMRLCSRPVLVLEEVEVLYDHSLGHAWREAHPLVGRLHDVEEVCSPLEEAQDGERELLDILVLRSKP
mmetsp:Transcript_36138/g.72755  ORF Transcript_36138/g.72755 Transcript_36138/m.72755 type:complete len:218 (-) Transcript_36138:98-751(-)